MQVLIVEDEVLAADRLRRLLAEADPSARIMGITQGISSTVDWLENHPAPDLILMDIELSDGQSFEIFKQTSVSVPVIFITSYDEFAIRAFKVNSIDYLLKPVRSEDLQQALEKFKSFSQVPPLKAVQAFKKLVEELSPARGIYRERFLVRSGQQYHSISTGEIAYFFYVNRETSLRTWANETYTLDYRLEEIEEMLDPREFFRANRQYLIHINSVKGMKDDEHYKLKIMLRPNADDEVVVSRERSAGFKGWMGK